MKLNKEIQCFLLVNMGFSIKTNKEIQCFLLVNMGFSMQIDQEKLMNKSNFFLVSQIKNTEKEIEELADLAGKLMKVFNYFIRISIKTE